MSKEIRIPLSYLLPLSLLLAIVILLLLAPRRKERARVDFVFDNMACHTWISIDGVKSQRKDKDPLSET